MDPVTELREAIEPALAEADAPLPTYREEIIRATRRCVLYGSGGFAVLCIVIGALESLLGR